MAEVKMALLIVHHNTFFRLSDDLTPYIQLEFKGPKAAENFSCRRTKTAAIVNCLGSHYQKELISDLRSTPFSIMLDGSNDTGLAKMFPVTVRVFDINFKRVMTKFPDMNVMEGNIHVGLLTNSLLKKLLEEDIDDRKAVAFFDSARKFYETAYKYCVKWFPLDDVFYKNCTFVDFAKRQSIDFEQIVSVIECFPTLKAKLHNDPRQLDACLEEFMIFQGLTDENIPFVAWNDAKVDVKPDKVFHRMDIIWGYLRERFPLLSSVALCVLTIPHSNVAEERVFSIIKKKKTTFPSSLD